MTLVTADAVGDDALAARVCIVGAGAAGITLACELDGCGFDVLLLEAGGLKPSEALSDYYRGAATPPHPDTTQFRRTIFGGTTGLWGGRCVALDPIDFARRDYVPGSGWPIGHAELSEFYTQAMQYCDAGRFDFSVQTALSHPQPTIAGYQPDGIVDASKIERYSLPTDFGTRYRQKIIDSRNVRGLLGARGVRIVKAAGLDRIEALEIVDPAGRRRRVCADVFVLAMGGIEVPRLLLSSDPEGPGLGNRNDCVGRFYMCHFENTFGRLVPHGAKVAFHFERTTDGVYCRRQFRFTPEALDRNRLLNMAFRLHFPSYSDATHGSSVMSTIYLAKSVLVPEYRAILRHNSAEPASPTLAHLRNVATGIPQLLRFAGDWVFRIKLARRKLPYTLVPNADGSFPVEFNSEQVPSAANRVSLLAERDRHGLPRVRVDWRLSEEDVDSASRAFGLLRQSMQASTACRLEFDDSKVRERMRNSQPLGGHHIGTARMAATPAKGVVDGNCAVFDLPNLFVASSAVFPTSGHANPTLTIVALAVRLARHLRAQL
jgi:choline dehydrogenase-like flavoprotein